MFCNQVGFGTVKLNTTIGLFLLDGLLETFTLKGNMMKTFLYSLCVKGHPNTYNCDKKDLGQVYSWSVIMPFPRELLLKEKKTW